MPTRIDKQIPPNRRPSLGAIRQNFIFIAEDFDALEVVVNGHTSAITSINSEITALKNSTDKLSANLWEKFSPIVLEDYSLSASITGWSAPSDGAVSFDTVNKGLRVQGSGVSGTDVITTKTLNRTLDATKVARVSIKYKSNTPGLISSLYLLAGNANNNFSALIAGANSIDIDTNSHGEWHWATFDTSEDSTFAALGNITQLRLRSNNQAAPYFTDITIAKIVINDTNLATFSFVYNDGHNSAALIAQGQLNTAGIKGTVFVPTSGTPDVPSGERLTTIQLDALRAAGWATSVDASNTGATLTSKANVEEAIQEYLKAQYEGSLLNFSNEHLKHLSFAGNQPWLVGARTQISAATSNGTNIVSLSSAVTVSTGSSYYGSGVPDGTTVVAGGNNVTQLTLNKNIPAQTKAAAVVDLTSQFNYNAILDRLKTVGVKGGKITSNTPANIIVEGFVRPLAVKGTTLIGLTLNQATTLLTRLMKTGSATPIQFGKIVADPVGWTADTPNAGNTIYVSFHQGVVTLIKTWLDQNKAKTLTFPDLIDRFTPDIQTTTVQQVTSTTNGGSSGVGVGDVEAVTAAKTLVQGDIAKILDVKTAQNITVSVGLDKFMIHIIPPASGVVTITPATGVTINGSTTALTRSAANNIVTLFPTSDPNVYKLTGV